MFRPCAIDVLVHN